MVRSEQRETRTTAQTSNVAACGGFVVRDLMLLRARGDAAAYMHFRDRYRDMARTPGFEGHMQWAEAMPSRRLPRRGP
jgi:hypothetical protein